MPGLTKYSPRNHGIVSVHGGLVLSPRSNRLTRLARSGSDSNCHEATPRLAIRAKSAIAPGDLPQDDFRRDSPDTRHAASDETHHGMSGPINAARAQAGMESLPITDALQASDDPTALPAWLPWRTGRKVGRTIYAQVGETASDKDPLIGVMDTCALAYEAVCCHNTALRNVQAASSPDPAAVRVDRGVSR